MYKYISQLFLLFLLGWSGSLYAQNDLECNPKSDLPISEGEVNINFGSVTNANSFSNQTSLIVGQSVVGRTRNGNNSSNFGFWSVFLLPPQAPIVTATQGDFLNRVQIEWKFDPLSSEPNEGFKILRDDAFLAEVDAETKEFIDFNVQAGERYEYKVVGINQFGSGVPGIDVGFVNPNGTVTGQLTTRNGNPVGDAIVTLEPTVGRSLEFDGVGAYVCADYHTALPSDMWTLTTWVKIDDGYDSDGIIDLGSDLNKNFWLQTTAAGQSKGVVMKVGDGSSAASLSHEFATDQANDWHHVAATYSDSTLLLFVDGQFIASKKTMIDTTAALFTIGSKRQQTDFFAGKIDDVRIYNKPLTQTDIVLGKNITASKDSEGIVAYWKFDEGLGRKAFDLSDNKINGSIISATFSSDTPEIKNGAMTDNAGFYAIQGVNYSSVQSFKAEPSKSFYSDYSIELNSAFSAHVVLTSFDLPDTLATIEVTVQPFDLNRQQTILSNGMDDFDLYIKTGKYYLTLNGVTHELGTANNEFQRLAIILDGNNNKVDFYNNGQLVGSDISYTNVTGDWSGNKWILGAVGETNPSNFMTGLVDEVVFYKNRLTLDSLQVYASTLDGGGTNGGNADILSYFSLNEDIKDYGSTMTGEGVLKNGTYSILARRSSEEPHEFEPNKRVVNLNSSNTAVGEINFTDVSTVTITGVIRFANTFCFQDSVEILVNGESHKPKPIITNKEGRFLGDFEPGATIELRPKFGKDSTEHHFSPTFFETRKLNIPIANVLFQNTTLREVEGQIFGGSCRKDIIRTNEDGSVRDTVWVKARSENGCFEKRLTVNNAAGKFEFDSLPPIPMTIAVTRFIDAGSDIHGFFSDRGGVEIDLKRVERDTVDFMYRSSPNIDYTDIPSVSSCSDQLVLNFGSYETTFKVYEDYEGGKCYIDSAEFTIKDGIANFIVDSVFTMSGGEVLYQSIANVPRLDGDHTKNLEVSVSTEIGTTTLDPPIKAIVLGTKTRGENTFTSVSPPIITEIIRDPPGDGSTASREAGSLSCGSIDVGVSRATNATFGFNVSLGPKFEAGVSVFGTTLAAEQEYVATNETRWSFNKGYNNGLVNEVCFENLETITTSEELIGEEGDIYIGTTVNMIWGEADELKWDNNSETCDVVESTRITIDPKGFNSQFMYTHHYIINNLIPELEMIATNEQIDESQRNDASASIKQWNNIIGQERERKLLDYDTYDDILTFDAGVTYEKSMSISKSEETTTSYEFEYDFSSENTGGFFGGGIGATGTLGFSGSRTTAATQARLDDSTTTYSYTLADDDIGDVFAVGVILPNSEAVTSQFELKQAQIEKEYYCPLNGSKIRGPFYDTKRECRLETICARPTTTATGYTNKDCERIAKQDNVRAIVRETRGNFNPRRDNLVHESLENDLFPEQLSNGDYPAPIFKYIAGTTSCPWEGGRQRENVSFAADRTIATNIDMNKPAVYKLEVGNQSPSEETREYQIRLVAGTNPDGAIVEIDGFSISSVPYTIAVPYDSVRVVTMTIKKGPSQFDYEGVKVAMYSECEYDASDAADGEYVPEYNDQGDLLNPKSNFYRELAFNTHFVEPCSSVEIGYPQEGHTVTPGNENLSISLNQYEETDPDLDYIAVQYRPIPGDGAWINITPSATDTLRPQDLDPVATAVEWQMGDLKDGSYQIRAIAFCKDLSLEPGMSTFFTINKETEAPQLFGTPEPADGILGAGDEISITFNEAINCDEVFDADGTGSNINLNNVALINTETNALVPFSSQCVGDKIVIQPEVNNRFINGKVLKARVTDIKDAAGNKMEVPVGAPGSPTVNYKEWEFLVDLNPLRWQAGSNIEEVIEEGNLKTITRNIINQSGTTMNYTITGPRVDNFDGSVTYEGIPDWMTITPYFGELEAGEVRTIQFTFPADLVATDYLSEINVVGSEGNHAIDANVRVTCPGPIWEFNPAQYQFTMSLTLQLDIEGEISTDKMDRVGAFINNELRGTAYIQHEPAIDPDGDGIGTHFVFLTIYSDVFQGEEIELKIWDVSDCLIYGEVLEDFTFLSDEFIGSPLEPMVVHTVNIVARTIQIYPGWNWFSYNVGLPNNSTADVLSTLTQPQDATIVGRRPTPGFSAYSETEGGFTGTLPNLTHESMYQYRSYSRDSIQLTGVPINVADVQIPIKKGWNWIGFIPQQALPLKEALSSLTLHNGDIVKSQTAFAQYVAGINDWIGSLNFMSPLVGYQLSIKNESNQILTYPESLKGESEVKFRNEPQFADYWTPQPELYEYNMNMIGMVVDGGNVLEDGDEVGVFYGDELRGVGKTVYVNHNDTYLIFLTAYANTFGEELTFRYYDRSEDQVHQLDETAFFAPNQLTGSVEEPTEWTLGQTVDVKDLYHTDLFNVFPNPASERVYLNFQIPTKERVVVSVKDALGKQIERIEFDAQAGMNNLEWTPTGLANGVYMISLEKEATVLTKRIMIQK